MEKDRKIRIPVDKNIILKLYQKKLCRLPAPDEVTKHLEDLKTNQLSPKQFAQTLTTSSEFKNQVAPLRRVVRQTYRDFLFQPPKEADLIRHVTIARHQLSGTDGTPNWEDVVKALGVRPINMEIDVTNQCNLRCVMCPFSHPSYYKRKLKFLPVKLFESFAKTFLPAVHSFSFSFGTEPLLHPNMDQLIRIATKAKIPRIYMNTNGLLLTEHLVNTMIETGFNGLSFSMDAAHQKTYESIRRGGDFTRLLNNIRMVNRLKEKAGAKNPDISLLFVLMMSNIRELPDFIDLAHQLGADGVNATHLIPFKLLDNQDQAMAEEKPLFNEMLQKAQDRANSLGIKFVSPPAFSLNHAPCKNQDRQIKERFNLNTKEKGENKSYCPFPWHFLAIAPTGEVMPCGWWHNQECMGNVYEEELLSIWGGQRFSDLRNDLKRNKPWEACMSCPAAGMGNPDLNSSFVSR